MRAKKMLLAVQLRNSAAAMPLCGEGRAAMTDPFRLWRMSKSEEPHARGSTSA